MRWDDETLVTWLQLHPNLKKPLVRIMFRRYKNLIFKEIAKQCDHRYDRDDLSQQIVLIFMQLLEEYDNKRGIPVAGFLKAKLPNRIYNFFKSQVRVWNAEVPHDEPRMIDGEEEGEEITTTTTELFEFWKEVAQCLDKVHFELLYWKFNCDYSTDEIAFLTNLQSRQSVVKGIESAIDKLRTNCRFIKQYGPKTFSVFTRQKHSSSSTSSDPVAAFGNLSREIMRQCGVSMQSKEVTYHLKTIQKIYDEIQESKNSSLDDLANMIASKCRLGAKDETGLRRKG